jgi:predicted amidohydrolase YtcJ
MRANKVLFRNGRIATLDKVNSIVSDVLVENGRISSLNPDLSKNEKNGIFTIDLKGLSVVPGFIDSHVHLSSDAGFMESGITGDFENCDSVEKVLDLVKERYSKAEEGQWIFGRRLYKDILMKMDRRILDRVCPNIPVLITAHGWHFGIANSLTLKLAGIGKSTPQPEGGEIQKDQQGEPTGILIQRGMDRLDGTYMPDAVMPSFSISQYKKAINAGCQKLIKFGITTIHDILVSPDETRAYCELLHDEELPLRVHLILRVSWGKTEKSKNPKYGESKIAFESVSDVGFTVPFGDEWLRFTGLKFSIDDMTGKIRIPEDELTSRLIAANERKQRVLVHALSYNGMDIALRSLETALRKYPRNDHRHRIEHSGNANCTIEHMRKMKELNITASLNPGFIYFLGEQEYVDKAKSEDDIFPLRSLLNSDLTIITNSDFGLIPPDPMKAIYFAVTRKTRQGNVIVPEQAISVEQALRQYTINAAYAGFEERVKGSLEVGKVADMVVLSEDPFLVDSERLREIEVLKTIIGGEIVYDRM